MIADLLRHLSAEIDLQNIHPIHEDREDRPFILVERHLSKGYKNQSIPCSVEFPGYRGIKSLLEGIYSMEMRHPLNADEYPIEFTSIPVRIGTTALAVSGCDGKPLEAVVIELDIHQLTRNEILGGYSGDSAMVVLTREGIAVQYYSSGAGTTFLGDTLIRSPCNGTQDLITIADLRRDFDACLIAREAEFLQQSVVFNSLVPMTILAQSGFFMHKLWEYRAGNAVSPVIHYLDKR